MSNDERGYAAAAEEVKRLLHVEIVPGTEILRDRELTVHTFAHSEGRDDVVRVRRMLDRDLTALVAGLDRRARVRRRVRGRRGRVGAGRAVGRRARRRFRRRAGGP